MAGKRYKAPEPMTNEQAAQIRREAADYFTSIGARANITALLAERTRLLARIEALEAEYIVADKAADELQALADRQKARIVELERLLNTPETDSFDRGVPLEAAHQQERWGAAHDAGKQPEDWFWLVGYLAGKALAAMKSGNQKKAQHHCISTAAALRNWHAQIREGWSLMRPGIGEEKQAIGEPKP